MTTAAARAQATIETTKSSGLSALSLMARQNSP
jgi:hypothetical protein